MSFLLYDFGFTIFNDTVVVTEDTLKPSARNSSPGSRPAARAGMRTSRIQCWPPKFADTWFKGTGRTIENEIFFNNAQKPLIETPNGILSMSEESIAKNIEALGQVGIKATKDMYDTSLLAEI